MREEMILALEVDRLLDVADFDFGRADLGITTI